MKQLFLASLLIAGLAGGPVLANSFTTGQRLYGLGDYRGAFSTWWPLADNGDARAQFGLALLYEKGDFVEKDLGLAKHWAKQAAKQGYQPAKTWLENKAGKPKASRQASTPPKTAALPAVPPRRVVEDPATAPNEAERLRRLIIVELEDINDRARNGRILYDDVEVRETGPASYRFSVKNIVVQRDTGGGITLGTVTGQVKDRSERFRDISLQLPTEIKIVNNRGKPGIIRLGKQDIRLTWDNTLKAIPVFDISVRDLTAREEGAQAPNLRIGELRASSQMKQQGKRWTGPMEFALSGVHFEVDGGTLIEFAGIGVKIHVANFDLARVLADRRETAAKGQKSSNDDNGLRKLVGLIAQLDVGLEVQGFTARLPDNGLIKLERAYYGANFSNLEKKNFDLRIDFGHQGLTGTGTAAPSELVPEQMRLLVDFERLPFETIARVGLAAGLQAFLLGGIQDGGRIVKELSEAAAAADFALKIRQAHFKAPILAGKMTGGFKADGASPLGVVGGLKSQIDGLARAMQHLRMKPRKDPARPQTSVAMMPLAMLFAMGEPSSDGKSHNYNLELRANGGVFLNGKPMTAGQSSGARRK